MTETTPGPWRAEPMKDGDSMILDPCGSVDFPVAIVRADPAAPDNAALIVEAVNSHDALLDMVAAVEAWLEVTESPGGLSRRAVAVALAACRASKEASDGA